MGWVVGFLVLGICEIVVGLLLLKQSIRAIENRTKDNIP